MDYFEILMKLTKKNRYKNDIPIFALIEKNDEILAISGNTREQTKNILGHAEINCIIKAAKKLNTWHLNDCNLYVTLKPCRMCENIIKSSRINNVYYLLDKSNKLEYNKTNFEKIYNNELSTELISILSSFFKGKRK